MLLLKKLLALFVINILQKIANQSSRNFLGFIFSINENFFLLVKKIRPNIFFISLMMMDKQKKIFLL
jgi:hypothetical protein